MKLDSVKVFLVTNPPPGFGGRYFVFLKLKTACGIEGVGEVYCATFGPRVIKAMIEDVFARRFAGRDPFQIEAMWRETYGSGFTLRPDVSVMGVLSGLEMACWDIIGKAVEQPVYNLLGGKVHERLRSYSYLYPLPGEGDDFYHDPVRSAERAAEYVAQGFTGLKFDPLGGYSAFDPRQPTQELARAHRGTRAPGPRGRRSEGGFADRNAWTVHGLGRDPARAPARSVRSAVVRRTRASRNARANGHRRARHEHPDRDRRAPDDQIRVRARARERRREHPANESRSCRRFARGKENRGARRSALRANRTASVLRTDRRGCQYTNRLLLAEFPDSREHHAVGRVSRRIAPEADSSGIAAT